MQSFCLLKHSNYRYNYLIGTDKEVHKRDTSRFVVNGVAGSNPKNTQIAFLLNLFPIKKYREVLLH